HLGEPRALASEEVAHLRVAFGLLVREEVDPLLRLRSGAAGCGFARAATDGHDDDLPFGEIDSGRKRSPGSARFAGRIVLRETAVALRPPRERSGYSGAEPANGRAASGPEPATERQDDHHKDRAGHNNGQFRRAGEGV